MATFYIGSTGNDATGDGSETNPWLNLNHAIAETSSIDTIIVKSGVIVQTEAIQQTSIENRSVIGETNNPNDNVIDFNGLSVFRFGASSNGVMENFTIQNIRQNTALPVFASFSVNPFEPASFNNMILRDIWIAGVTNPTLPSAGLFSAAKVTIRNTLIYDIKLVDGIGVTGQLFGMDRFGGFINLENVVYYDDNLSPLGSLNVPRIFVARANPDQSISFNVKNSIMMSKNTGEVLEFFLAVSVDITFTALNSCFHNVEYDQGGSGVITDDPLFVDSDNNDFRLRPISPCIGTGGL